MPQTVTVNIVSNDNLPQLGAMSNWLTEYFALISLLALLLVAGVVFLVAKTLKGGGTTLRHNALFVLSFLILTSLSLLTILPASSTSYAAGALTGNVKDAVIDIPQGETTGSVEFEFDVTGYTDGFNLLAQINSSTSVNLPGLLSVELDGASITDSAATTVREWRETAPDTSLLTVTVTVPQDAPSGNDYAVISLNYTADDYIQLYTFQNPSLLSPFDSEAIQFTSVTCNTGMKIYGTTGTLPDTIEVTDTRNSQAYRVRKLVDGKCWMIDNLKYELENALVLSPASTNVTTATTVYFTQDSTSTGAALGGLTDNFTTSGYQTRSGTNSGVDPNQDAWRQSDPGTTAFCASSADAAMMSQDSLTRCGYHYNFFTATAGSGTQSSYSATARTAPNSICPAGWRLPTTYANDSATYDTGDYPILNASLNAGVLTTPGVMTNYYANWLPTTSAWQTVYAGYYGNAFGYNGGTLTPRGLYWSSSASANNSAVSFRVNNDLGTVDAQTNALKYNGFAVRCVL